jgi:N-acyl homoserine lactone hydrolase
MKIFALHIGDTRFPYGQFYGGGEDWTGLGAIWYLIRDKDHYILVPIYAYLIDHPKAGPILVDTGINWQQAHNHKEYYKGILLQLVLDEDEYQITREQELSAHLKRLGYRLEDIKTVIVTHLHEDHLGGLRSLAHAKIMITKEEWNAKNLGIFPFNETPSIKGFTIERELVSYTSGPFHGFDKSQDLLGDGSVIILPTPGHSAGHLAVLIQLDGYQLLCAGDTLYTLRHLAVNQVRPISLGKKAWARQAGSIERILHLRRSLPDTIVAPAHDHTAYMSEYLEPFLADGNLSSTQSTKL